MYKPCGDSSVSSMSNPASRIVEARNSLHTSPSAFGTALAMAVAPSRSEMSFTPSITKSNRPSAPLEARHRRSRWSRLECWCCRSLFSFSVIRLGRGTSCVVPLYLQFQSKKLCPALSFGPPLSQRGAPNHSLIESLTCLIVL